MMPISMVFFQSTEVLERGINLCWRKAITCYKWHCLGYCICFQLVLLLVRRISIYKYLSHLTGTQSIQVLVRWIHLRWRMVSVLLLVALLGLSFFILGIWSCRVSIDVELAYPCHRNEANINGILSEYWILGKRNKSVLKKGKWPAISGITWVIIFIVTWCYVVVLSIFMEN